MGLLFFGLVEEVYELGDNEIIGEIFREVVLRMKGVGGFLNVDVNGF